MWEDVDDAVMIQKRIMLSERERRICAGAVHCPVVLIPFCFPSVKYVFLLFLSLPSPPAVAMSFPRPSYWRRMKSDRE